MAGKGGKREGAGRKPHALTVKKVQPEVINAGILPLEMRLRVARELWAGAVDADGKITDLDKAKEAADFAEPALAYTSPKLQSIYHMGADGGAVKHEHSVVDEVSALIAEEAKRSRQQPSTKH